MMLYTKTADDLVRYVVNSIGTVKKLQRNTNANILNINYGKEAQLARGI